MSRPERTSAALLLTVLLSTGGPATITAATALEWRSYNNNNNTGEENSAGNQVVLNQVLRGFWYFDDTGAVTPDTEFGTYEKTGDDPLTVRYTFPQAERWSDGEPLDCDDLLLARAANSGGFGRAFSTAGTTGCTCGSALR